MSFTAITSGEITSGEPVAANTQTKIKNNFDDHETRIESLESVSSAFPPIIFRVNGPYALGGAVTDLLKTTFNLSLTITSVRILVDQAGSSGSLEIDLLKKRGGGSFTSIFTVKPIISYASGNDALSSAGTLDGAQTGIVAGDILRLDTTSVQLGGKGFLVRIDYSR